MRVQRTRIPHLWRLDRDFGTTPPVGIDFPMTAAAQRPEEERRAAVRHLRRATAPRCAVEAPEKEERWPARIRDVSATGFGLLIGRPFAIGVVLEVELEGDLGPDKYLAMRVVRVAPAGADQWLLGCVLEQRLEKGELRALL